MILEAEWIIKKQLIFGKVVLVTFSSTLFFTVTVARNSPTADRNGLRARPKNDNYMFETKD